MSRALLFLLFLVGCPSPNGGDSKDTSGGGGGKDADGDGWTGKDGDCDDADAAVNPDATEACDSIDNDCNGTIDDAAGTYYVDADEDGYGDPTTGTAGCPPGTGYTTDKTDCLDTDEAINPGAEEVCDGVDNNCDGTIDDGTSGTMLYRDVDGDGYGDPSTGEVKCGAEAGWVEDGTDCDDHAAAVNPDASEVCNGQDDNCDDSTDGADATDASTWYRDADHDTYGDLATAQDACDAPAGFVADSADCDDAVAAVNPGAAEVCNTIDDDCDGDVDESGGAGTFYPDVDADGYGDESLPYSGCEAPEGYLPVGGDCDDTDPTVNPLATDDPYDGIDSDCSGGSDYDADGDGYASRTYGGGDCNDADAGVYPGAKETAYDGIDGDCSGGSDYDADGDGYDSDAYGGDDCDDADSAINPGALDVDDTVDWNCDGVLNTMPVADAQVGRGSDEEVCFVLQLDGTGSYDPDGGSLTYAWELVSAPAGSTLTSADLSSVAEPDPTFIPDVAGDYTLLLVVTDDEGAVSIADTLTVTVAARTTNTAPVADAGGDQEYSASAYCTPISYGTEYSCRECGAYNFTLDGSGSYDADGEDIDYTWSVGSGSGTLLSSPGSQNATVQVASGTPAYGSSVTTTVTVRLTVTDCFGATSAYNTATLTYTCTGD